MLHEQQPDSNRLTIIKNFGENSLFNPSGLSISFEVEVPTGKVGGSAESASFLRGSGGSVLSFLWL